MTSLLFDAEQFAAAWLAVFAATGQDEMRPLLHRTLNIETHADGVRLAALDGYMLLSCAVPHKGRLGVSDGPAVESITVHDPDHRGRDLLKFAYKTVTAKDAPPDDIGVSFGPGTLEDGQFAGMEQDVITLTFPAISQTPESVSLSLMEQTFPEWRQLVEREDKTTREVALSLEVLSRLATVRQRGFEHIRLTFDGPLGPIILDANRLGMPLQLVGALMPVRMSGREAEAD